MKSSRRRLALLLALLLAVLSACAQDKSGAYNRAVSLFAGGEFAEAAAAFDRLGDYAQSAAYAAYSHGLVLYDQGQYAAAEPYFEQTRSFMYGEERYQYCHAHSLALAGQFAQAGACFEAVGAFEDAPVQAQYCLARDAEERKDYGAALFGYEASVGVADAEDRLYNLQGQLYNRAIALKNEGQFDSAITLFSLLGDYLSSAQQAVECNSARMEAQYDEADSLEAGGQLQAAFETFSALSSYRDAAARAESLAERLGLELPDHSDE